MKKNLKSVNFRERVYDMSRKERRIMYNAKYTPTRLTHINAMGTCVSKKFIRQSIRYGFHSCRCRLSNWNCNCIHRHRRMRSIDVTSEQQPSSCQQRCSNKSFRYLNYRINDSSMCACI